MKQIEDIILEFVLVVELSLFLVALCWVVGFFLLIIYRVLTTLLSGIFTKIERGSRAKR